MTKKVRLSTHENPELFKTVSHLSQDTKGSKMRPSSCPDQVIGVQCEVLDRWIPSKIERPDIHSFNMRREDLLGPDSSLAGSHTMVLVYLSYRYCRFKRTPSGTMVMVGRRSPASSRFSVLGIARELSSNYSPIVLSITWMAPELQVMPLGLYNRRCMYGRWTAGRPRKADHMWILRIDFPCGTCRTCTRATHCSRRTKGLALTLRAAMCYDTVG